MRPPSPSLRNIMGKKRYQYSISILSKLRYSISILDQKRYSISILGKLRYSISILDIKEV